MANAIKQISIARGHDVTRYVLQCFGGAGGQHACLVADALGIGTVMIHPLAGVLSAYGMGLADLVELRQRSLGGGELEAALAELEAEAVAALAAQGVAAPEVLRRAALRYEGSDTALEVPVSADMRADFEAAHKQRFGFVAPETAVVVETAIVEARSSSPEPGGGPRAQRVVEGPLGESQDPLQHAAHGPPPPAGEELYDRAALRAGDVVTGPALIIDPSADHRRRAGLAGRGGPRTSNLILTRAVPARRGRGHRTEADPVMLEVMANLFMAIAEEMGVALQNTASSVNIKERLDFSCALFDARRRADRQRAAHPGASRLDGRQHPDDHRRARRAARRAGHEARRRLCAERALSRRHPSARHHRDHAGLRRRRAMRRRPGSSRRAGIMPISAGSRPARCRRTAARCMRRAC